MLRRVVANFRRQDWTAVVVELAVVVIGVFIGLQAANWNEDRQKNQKAAEFTERLKADLRVEAWNYETQIGYFNQVQANATRAVDALTGTAPLADDALLIAAYRATQYNSNSRRRATYDELTSTGEIGLIHDAALRALAMDVYTLPLGDRIEQGGMQSEYRKAFRTAIPYQVQRSLADKCGDRIVPIGDYAGIAQVLDYPCATGLAPETIAASAAILRKDPRFVALLQLRIADIATDLSNMTVYFDPYIREPLRRLAKDKP
ncbi:hypothetical protein [Rudaea cellulosilytica]|uniref:hypothetical protein n=1 Tax=Rudaea cellulosilytica TaxID=540746 RepID=UPI0003814840|nr:hypothetical protein [Rudaea cellulosilytica]